MTVRALRLAVVLGVSLWIAVGCNSDDSSTPPTTLSPSSTELSVEEADQLGRELVTDYYDDLTSKDIEALADGLDESFQSVTATGTRSKQGVLDLVTSASYGAFELTDFKATTTAGTLIVSYKARLEVNGQPTGPTERVNVFRLLDGQWKGVVYADAGTPSPPA